MAKNSKTEIQSFLGNIDRINDAPFGHGQTTNSAMARKIGDDFGGIGVRDFATEGSKPIDGDTMLGEGSIGKVRFAGLAYMLQQDGIIDLQQNTGEFFARPSMGTFLNNKYPGQDMQQEILKLFSGDSKDATLADLTTHRAGVGDLTRDQGRLFNKQGISQGYQDEYGQSNGKGRTDQKYDIPVLLKIPEDCMGIPRDDSGKPHAQHAPSTPDKDLPKAQYGMHQYSNLGYALLGIAMEESYVRARGVVKDYKELMNDYMLHPKTGRAEGAMDFNSTKFPQDIKPEDNCVTAQWKDKATGKQVNANQFDGANAAGGILASANDSSKYFQEFFRGFPGTPEEGKNANVFFTDETIAKMKAEWKKFPPAGTDSEGNLRYQGPGFVATVNPLTKEVLQYEKNGGTFGYISNMEFNPKTGAVDIAMIAQENVSADIAKEAGVKLPSLMAAYMDKDKVYDRSAMFKDYQEFGVERIQEKVASRSKENDLYALSKDSQFSNALQDFRNSTKVKSPDNVGILADGIDSPKSSIRDKIEKASVTPEPTSGKKYGVGKMQSTTSKGSREI